MVDRVPKIFKLLSSLGDSEKKIFYYFIRNSKRLRILSENILQIIKKEKHNEQEILMLIYGKTTLSTKNKYTKDLSKLRKYALESIAIQKILSNPLKRELTLLEDFRTRLDGSFFKSQEKKVDKTISKNKINLNYFHNIYLKIYLSLNKVTADDNGNFYNLNSALEKDFILKKLYYMVQERIHYFNKHYYQIQGIPVLEYLENNFDINEPEPIIMSFFFSYKILASGDNRQSNYIKLKRLILFNDTNFHNDILVKLYEVLHHCIVLLFPNNDARYIEHFELIDSQVRNNLLFINNKISKDSFNLIVSVSLELNKLNFAEDFLYTQKGRINPISMSKPLFYYNLSRICLYRFKFELARDMLQSYYNQKIISQDIILNLNVRILEVIILLELKGSNLLFEGREASLRMYLSRMRGKVNSNTLKKYSNLANMIFFLYRFSYNPNLGLDDLEKYWNNLDDIPVYRKWMLKKIENIKKSISKK